MEQLFIILEISVLSSDARPRPLVPHGTLL
jgi:hypothetical protein